MCYIMKWPIYSRITLFFSAPKPNKPLMYGVTPTFFTIGALLKGHVDAGYPGAPIDEV